MRTWEDELRARSQPHIGHHQCPACGGVTRAFAIVQEADGRWRCADCRIDEERGQHRPHSADWVDVRAERDRILADTDWTEAPGPRRAMSKAQAGRWDALRAHLRDVPQLSKTPSDAMALLGDARTQAQGLRFNNPKE